MCGVWGCRGVKVKALIRSTPSLSTYSALTRHMARPLVHHITKHKDNSTHAPERGNSPPSHDCGTPELTGVGSWSDS